MHTLEMADESQLEQPYCFGGNDNKTFKTTLEYENTRSELILFSFVFASGRCKCFTGDDNRIIFTCLPTRQANAVIYKAPEIRSEDQGS